MKNEEQYEFSDDSAPLFAMYQKKTENEDSKMTDRWQKDADGVLIFVSPQSTGFSIASKQIIDRFILRRCCGVTRSDPSRPQTKSTGYDSILSQEHLSGSRRCQHISIHTRHPS
jgi:hypothetical protein